MAQYILLFRGREIAQGSLSTVVASAAVRGAIKDERVASRGWTNGRLLIDLRPDYELRVVDGRL